MRAAIELPAVAIFTIVAGSLIILFFVLLAQSQGSSAERSTQARSLQFLDTLIKSAATQGSTSTNITVIDSTLLFECDATGSWYGYQGGEQLPIYNILIFSPEKLTGGQLEAKTLPSSVPFKALNVLYLETDRNLVYYSENNQNDIAGFPFPVLTGSGDSSYRTIVEGSATMGSNTVKLIPASDPSYGQVMYFGGDTVTYPNKELMYGALLSKDKDTYDCVFNEYLDQVKFVSKVLEMRAEDLRASYDPNNPCWSKYQTDAFITIENLPRAQDFSLTKAEEFQQAAKKIEFVNGDLLSGDNCVSLY